MPIHFTFVCSAIPGFVRFRRLEVSASVPTEVFDYLVRNRRAFHGAVFDIDIFMSGNNSINPFHVTAAFWRFLERLADGHCQDQSNSQSNNSITISASSPAPPTSMVWFHELWLQRIVFSQQLVDHLFRLPFVRRHIIVRIRISTFELAGICARGIVDWLFDDTDYYRDNGPIGGPRRCFGHRHLAIYIGRSRVSQGDPFPLITAIKEKVSIILENLSLRNGR